MCNLGFQQWLFHKMTSGEMEDVPVIEEINNQTGSLVTKDVGISKNLSTNNLFVFILYYPHC